MSSDPSLSPPAAKTVADSALPAPVSSSSSHLPLWRGAHGGLRDFLMTHVDPNLSTIPLAAYCFMTGWMCAALHSCLPFYRDHLVSYHRTATQCLSPPYSFGAHSRRATRYRYVLPPPTPPLRPQRPLTVKILNHVACTRARAPFPGFSRASRHLVPPRG
jgi:hypothetical protein